VLYFASGFAHIGVLRALAEHGIVPQVITGTSFGALVGGAYAAGKLDVVETWAKSFTWRDLFKRYFGDVSLQGAGIMYGDALEREMLEKAMGFDPQIENLAKTFGAVATDLRTGKEVWLNKGSLLKAIRCSVSIPGLLTPGLGTFRRIKDGVACRWSTRQSCTGQSL